MLSTLLKSVDIFPVIATTSTLFTLSVTVIGLLVIPISIGVARGLSIGNKVNNEIYMEDSKKT